MRRKKLVLLASVLAFLVVIAWIIPISISSKLTVATIYPSPYGYIYVLDKPVGEVVGLYVGKSFVDYKAYTPETRTIFAPYYLSGFLSKEYGRMDLKIVYPDIKPETVVVNLPGETDYIISTGDNHYYYSNYDVYLNGATVTKLGNNTAVVTKTVNLNTTARITYIIPYTSRGDTVTIISKKYSLTEKISDLVGIKESCVAFVKPTKSFPWYGGVIPTAICKRSIHPVITGVYNGQPLITAFYKEVGGKIVYVVFSEITVKTLEGLGIITPILSAPNIHVIPVDTKVGIIYRSVTDKTDLSKVKEVNAIDTTEVINGKHICVLPQSSTIITYSLWKPRNFTYTNIELAPGEFILYKAQGNYYTCRGDMGFFNIPPPTIKYPTIKQLKDPLSVSSSSTALIVLGNGKIYYGKKFKIPYNDYTRNTVWVVTHNPYIVTITSTSIFGTGFFWLSVIMGSVFIFLLIQKPKEGEKVVRVIWDIAPPPPMELSTKSEIIDKVKKYIESKGVCPSDIELAEKGVLLPYNGESPKEELIVCNFETNKETERILRKVENCLENGFWAMKRRGRNYGYTYTIIGDMLLVFYIYKQEKEDKPVDVLLNGVEAIKKTYIGIPLHTKYGGLILVTTRDMAKKIRNGLLTSGAIDRNGMIKNMADYLKMHTSMTDEEIGEIVKFMREKAPSIVVVSDDLKQMIKRLGDEASFYYEEYLSRSSLRNE